MRLERPLAGPSFDLRALFAAHPWSATLIGISVYVFGITTFRIEVGDYAVALALGGLLLQREPLRFPPFLIAFGVFLLWCALGLLSTSYPWVVEEEVINFAKLGLILFAVVNGIQTHSRIQLFIMVWLGGYMLYPARGALQNYFGGYRLAGRAIWNGTYSNPNDLAALTLLQLFMMAGIAVTQPKGWVKRGAIAWVVLLTLLILLTQSRGAIPGLALSGLLVLVGMRQRLRSLAFVAVLGASAAFIVPSSAWDRFGSLLDLTSTENLESLDDEGSAEQRYQIWQTSWKITRDYPLLGVGWGAYPQANADYAPAEVGSDVRLGARDAHSTYFRTAAETGLVGLLIFLALILVPVLKSGRVRRRLKTVAPSIAQQMYLMELGLLAYLLAGIFGSFSRLSHLYLYLAVIYMLAHVYELHYRSELRFGFPEVRSRTSRA